ncbi:bifunctional UDP-2,4-diacetamido-2,4,6-trideoxy-beta-L-altropyranose hydrolase/GNAT family N-acetyltransferase [Microbacterium sp. SS28]|uniref:bifunctional UDP-2,4-diacetamido-2,4,6-trideoxy-beta-L-altropyranose hydrolase/GNAT family N-acetyltransferase n=1 Tax=Microbacterium sp. SS28 TaxID=2919948 RepID=UPI001FAA3054|nr:bifunctional UDP-2,4-diacetamido-2,4,6-trideoxy-beta-L-altropyranose hydrolase/GNAT family N-acetyltransferase [Microbacterium sp. SS28]
MRKRALIFCDAGLKEGMGHMMRSLAVAQEAQRAKWDVTLAGHWDEAATSFIRRAQPTLPTRTIRVTELDHWSRSEEASASFQVLHLDSYRVTDDLRRAGIVISSMQDGRFGARPSDLAIDANLFGERSFERPEASLAQLAGASAAIVRDQVRAQRGAAGPRTGRPRILIVLGGTDPNRITARAAERFARIRTPLALTIVCRPDQRSAVKTALAQSAHEVTVCSFLDDLPAVARRHDAVVSAAGTSVWDFACMGIPMGLVCVTENQRAGYDAAVEAGLAYPLGSLAHEEDMEPFLEMLLTESTRAQVVDRLLATVDGLGAWRLVAAWDQLLDVRPSADEVKLTARTATRADAGLLFQWRNHPKTRAFSRSQDEVTWSQHVAWLDGVLGDAINRQLLVIEDGDQSVGTVRWDRRSEGWEVSITVAPIFRGRGYAVVVLAAGEAKLEAPRPTRLLATVQRDNIASRRLFAKAGYLPHEPTDAAGFAVYSRWRFPATANPT